MAQKYQTGYENLRKMVQNTGMKLGAAREAKQWTPAVQAHKKTAADGMRQSQKLMLTWLIEEPGLFASVEPFLAPEDFTEELYRKVAEAVFCQCREGRIRPAKVIDLFSDEKEQQEVASLFHAQLKEITTEAEKAKALKETIIRIKENSMNSRSKRLEPTDLDGLQKLVADKKSLQRLNQMEFWAK